MLNVECANECTVKLANYLSSQLACTVLGTKETCAIVSSPCLMGHSLFNGSEYILRQKKEKI